MLPILLIIDEITREDERELLRRLFFTYAPKMKQLAKSILQNDADAEDALHDAFLLVIRYRKKFVQSDEIEIKRLLVIYSRSVCFNRLRREKRMRAHIVPEVPSDADDGLHPAEDIPDADADPGEALLTKEQSDLLRRAIDRLPSPAREIVWLRYYAGHTNVEIGALLGIKPSTVGSTLRRSLAKIQNETEAYFVDR